MDERGYTGQLPLFPNKYADPDRWATTPYSTRMASMYYKPSLAGVVHDQIDQIIGSLAIGVAS